MNGPVVVARTGRICWRRQRQEDQEFKASLGYTFFFFLLKMNGRQVTKEIFPDLFETLNIHSSNSTKFSFSMFIQEKSEYKRGTWKQMFVFSSEDLFYFTWWVCVSQSLWRWSHRQYEKPQLNAGNQSLVLKREASAPNCWAMAQALPCY